MTTTLSVDEFTFLRDYVRQEWGIELGDEKDESIETQLTGLMSVNGCEDFGAFVRLIQSNTQPQLRDEILDAMISKETCWFRDTHPFVILRERILPELAEGIRAGSRSRIRIWSAGCSTGQEPYSMALTAEAFCRTLNDVRPDQFEILGTDISPSGLLLAMAARYDRVGVGRGLPRGVLEHYFTQEQRTWQLDPRVKQMVRFEMFDVQEPVTTLGRFDVVFLRYVAGCFSESLRRKIFANLTEALSPWGFLVLGEDESPAGAEDSLERLDHAGGCYYRKRFDKQP